MTAHHFSGKLFSFAKGEGVLSLPLRQMEDYIIRHNKTHLIFDFDETIAMLIIPWEEWFKDVAGVIAKKAPEISGKTYAQAHNEYVEKHGDKALEHIRKLNEIFETKNLKGVDVNTEIISFIKNNRQYKYFIWSSNSRKTIKSALKKLGILDRFEKIITRSETQFIKPHPDGFKFIEEENIPRSSYLFIGDSSYDEQAAKTIGIDFYKISYFSNLSQSS